MKIERRRTNDHATTMLQLQNFLYSSIALTSITIVALLIWHAQTLALITSGLLWGVSVYGTTMLRTGTEDPQTSGEEPSSSSSDSSSSAPSTPSGHSKP